MSSKFIVIGAGALGLAAAEQLLLEGGSVTVLERQEAGRESSWAGGGILSPLCPWDYTAAVNRLASYGAAAFAEWAETLHQATGIDPEYERSGMLLLPPFDVALAQQWCDAHGVSWQMQAQGMLLPEVAQVRNSRLMRALRARVLQLGGRILEQAEVKAIKAVGNQVEYLETAQGRQQADRYIVTAGAWTTALLGEHAAGMAVRPVRGQMLLYKFDAPPVPHIILQKDLYLIPRRDGHLLVGSTLEEVGFDKRITPEAREMLRQRAEAVLPELRDMSIVQHWAGLRPGSAGNIPTIGRHPQLENLYANSGHFRYGVTMAPASVQLLMNELQGATQPFDVTPYRWG